MDIEQLRLNHINKPTLSIRNENTIKRLAHTTMVDQNFQTKRIKELKEQNIQKETRLDNIKTEILDTQRGEHDSVFISDMDISRERQNELNVKQNEKKLKKIPSKVVYYNQPHEISNFSIQKEYAFYIRSVESIPEYMLNNLERMANNRGYVWKGTYLFGKLREEPNRPLTIFNKNLIHEYTPTEFNIYSKEGRKNVLIKSIPRKKMNKF